MSTLPLPWWTVILCFMHHWESVACCDISWHHIQTSVLTYLLTEWTISESCWHTQHYCTSAGGYQVNGASSSYPTFAWLFYAKLFGQHHVADTSTNWRQSLFCCCTASMEQATDGAETAAIDGLVSSRSENISVSFRLRASEYGLTLWYALSLLVGGAIRVPQLQLQLHHILTNSSANYASVNHQQSVSQW